MAAVGNDPLHNPTKSAPRGPNVGPWKILLVDDHPFIPKWLAGEIKARSPESSIQIALNVREALDLCNAHPDLDFIMLDLVMPGVVGLDAFYQIAASGTKANIAIITGLEDVELMYQAWYHGHARGWIPKSHDTEQLIQAIVLLLSGGFYYPPEMIQRYEQLQRQRADTVARIGITPRQLDMLRLLVNGRLDKDIAKELNLSVQTVKNYQLAVRRLLNARNRREVIEITRRLNLF
jgi:DNA-binding NarL/FixJ family response regulator